MLGFDNSQATKFAKIDGPIPNRAMGALTEEAKVARLKQRALRDPNYRTRITKLFWLILKDKGERFFREKAGHDGTYCTATKTKCFSTTSMNCVAAP